MGQRELLAALHRAEEEQASSIRRAAAEEAGRLRSDADRRLDELQAGERVRCEKLCAARRREILAETERKASLVRLQAEHELARRLRERAALLLGRLRCNGYAALFKRLAAELPDAPWGTIRVNPDDTSLAAVLFPAAAIEADSSIAGGLESATADGTFSVVNTLEARLERAWPDLLPLLAAGLRGQRP